MNYDRNQCPVVHDEDGVIWDVICFAFLIIQLRIFNSYYFCHIVNETKASALLAERGAEIIEDLRLKEIRYREKQEEKILRKIKRKMEKIRATQHRALGEKTTHYDEYALSIENRGTKPLIGHAAAVRAGDYYMFDDMDEKFELDLLEEEEDYLEATGKINTTEKKLKDRQTFYEVYKSVKQKKIQDKVKNKSRSAPTSQIGIKIEEESKVHSDPLPIRPTTSNIQGDSEQPTDSHDTTAPKKSGDKDEIDLPREKEDKRNVIIRILEGILVSCAIRLNQYSRHYRYVMKILSKEKKTLMEDYNFSHDKGQITKKWEPFKFLLKQSHSDQKIDNGRPSSSSSSHDTPTTSRAVKHSTTQSDIRSEPEADSSAKVNNIDSKTLDIDQKDLERIDIGSQDTESTSKKNDDDFDEYEDDFMSQEHYIVVEFFIALWYSILANTDFVCYFIIFIIQIVSASVLSLPLPFMVFMWGTLSLPRPTKTFWVTLIAYTLSVVLIKCIFQFKTIWHEYLTLPNQPLSSAAIIGIEPKKNYAVLDLVLLLALFFHRFVLKSQGLWKSSYVTDDLTDAFNIFKEKLPQKIKHPDVKKAKTDVTETAVIEKGSQVLVLSKHDSDDLIDPDEINVEVSNVKDDSSKYQFPSVMQIKSAKYCSSFVEFFKGLIYITRLPCDVYAFMFLCDFTNFFVLLLGFTAFGSEQSDGGGVSTYLADNKVPIPFLIMLLIQFFLIIADRAIYLRKSLIHKIIYHYFTIVGIHIWMFFLVPAVTERRFNALAPPIIFYLIKCFYFLLSSYQIRCGYPKRILGNFLCKGFTIMNSVAFKIYMAIPFLYELRTFLDWVCTESTFTVFDWLKMENIYSEIFLLKCARQFEKDFPVPRAVKKPIYSKIIMGGIAVVAIVVLVWAPLTLFALNSAVGHANIPFRMTALLQIGAYEPIFEVRAADNIKPFTFNDKLQMEKAYKTDRTALTFITSYDEDDIAAIMLQTSAPELWRISPPNKDLLIADLKMYKDIPIHFSYAISRSPPNKQASETLSGERKYILKHKAEKEALLEMLNGVQNNKVVTFDNLFPKFIKMKNSGEMIVLNQLTPKDQEYRNISIKLLSDENDPSKIWWEIKEACSDEFHKTVLKNIPYNRMCDKHLTIITFNDKKFPDTFSFLTAGGIIGMYTTFILVAARVLRSSFITGASRNIMFQDLPYVDRVLQLCLDIYLVREAQEFALEEDLFAKLIFLYRSPETMIKWTRPKEQEFESDETASIHSRVSRRR